MIVILYIYILIYIYICILETTMSFLLKGKTKGLRHMSITKKEKESSSLAELREY